MSIRNLLKHSLMRVSSWANNDHGSKILYYHDVYRDENYKALDTDIYMGTHIDLFAKHVEVIRKEGYQIVPRISEPKGQVAILFDDGFRGIWECRHFFYENKIYPTIFLPVDFIGASDKGILNLEEIRELQNNGFLFESHGWTHRPLTEVPESEMNHELEDSRLYLEEKLGKKVTGLCLPLGYFTEDIISKALLAGYKDIYSSIPGTISDKPHDMISRNLCQYATPHEVRLILRGGNQMLKSRYERLHNHDSK